MSRRLPVSQSIRMRAGLLVIEPQKLKAIAAYRPAVVPERESKVSVGLVAPGRIC